MKSIQRISLALSAILAVSVLCALPVSAKPKHPGHPKPDSMQWGLGRSRHATPMVRKAGGEQEQPRHRHHRNGKSGHPKAYRPQWGKGGHSTMRKAGGTQ